MELFPLFYAGNIRYFKLLIQADHIVFEVKEHFPKQTYRNRIEIVGPNGLQRLSIPIRKTGQRTTMEDVQISYEEQWQKDHWKSLEAAYRRSPYFEFYEDRLHPFYKEKIETLTGFNLGLLKVIDDALNLNLNYSLSEDYNDPNPRSNTDHRETDFSSRLPTADQSSYIQVFNDRHPFIPNLSILDALFNLGPSATGLLK